MAYYDEHEAPTLSEVIRNHAEKFDRIHGTVVHMETRVAHMEKSLGNIGETIAGARGAIKALLLVTGMILTLVSAIAGYAMIRAMDADTRSITNERVLEYLLQVKEEDSNGNRQLDYRPSSRNRHDRSEPRLGGEPDYGTHPNP